MDPNQNTTESSQTPTASAPQETTSKWSFATRYAIIIFIFWNITIFITSFIVSKQILQSEGLGGLAIIYILPILFIYATVILPLWVLLILKLHTHSVIAAGISILFQPIASINMLGTIHSLVNPNATQSSGYAIASIILYSVIYISVTAIFVVEFLRNRDTAKQKKKEKQQEKVVEQVASPTQKVESTTVQEKIFPFALVISVIAAYINFTSFSIWFAIASIPFAFVTLAGGTAYPYSANLFGIYFPFIYFALLFEIPFVAFLIYRLCRKIFYETYLHILLVLFITTFALMTFSIFTNPNQITIPALSKKPVENVYDFSKRVIISTSQNAKHDVVIEGNYAAWVEHVKKAPENPFNIWDIFLLSFDTNTGKSSTQKITNFEFSPTQSPLKNSVKIIDGKVYWKSSALGSIYRYDPATAKTDELTDKSVPGYPEECDPRDTEIISQVNVSNNGTPSEDFRNVANAHIYTCNDKYIVFDYDVFPKKYPFSSVFAIYERSKNETIFSQKNFSINNREMLLVNDVFYYEPAKGTSIIRLDLTTLNEKTILANEKLDEWDINGNFLFYQIDTQEYASDLYIEKLLK